MRLVFAAVMLAFLVPSTAQAREPLTKHDARAAGLRFTAPFVDMLDVNRTVKTHMVRSGLCHRVSPRTVECRFWAYLSATQTTVSGSLRVHRQRSDGRLGFLLPWDPADFWVPIEPPSGSSSAPAPGSGQ